MRGKLREIRCPYNVGGIDVQVKHRRRRNFYRWCVAR